MIVINNLNKSYNNVKILKNISLKVESGEIFSLLGPNGAGKTTIIRIINGLTKRDSGNIYIDNIDIFKSPQKGKSLIGLIPQSVNLDIDLSVEENLIIHGLLFSMKFKEIKSQIEELLKYVGMYEKRGEKVKNLSGGMRRRVLIARALLHKPKILFLDEPTVGLDPSIRRKIWWLVKKIQSKGTTIFLTTHYIEEAEFLSDRVGFIDNGEIIEINTPKNFIKRTGEWALDILETDREDFKTLFFKDKNEIQPFITDNFNKINIRRVNLEDVFVKLTGRKVKNA